MTTIYTELFTQLLRAEIELWNSLDAHVLTQAGVTLPTLQALRAIQGLRDPVRVQDISEEMSITVGATSKVVDRLQRDGLVRREANPDDRRSSIIVLTGAGSQSLGAAESAAEKHLASMLSTALPTARATALTAELSAIRGLVVAS